MKQQLETKKVQILVKMSPEKNKTGTKRIWKKYKKREKCQM